MIDRPHLLSDLQALVRKLEADLQERIDSTEVPEVGQRLWAEYDQAKQAERTAQTFNQWATDYTTQMAVAWVLSATFARFLEDNGLVSPPRISGRTGPHPPNLLLPREKGEQSVVQTPLSPGRGAGGEGSNLQRARDEHEVYFRAHPTETDREYLLWMFRQLARLPGAQEIFGEGNLIWELPTWLSGDGAKAILAFFQTIDPSTGALVHDFSDPDWDTRFLGDLYQDLSEAARKKYALLQTPIFVEQFILDRTLDPAIDEFGLATVRMIDPACGSGHFLLGAFERLLNRWLRQEPGTNVEELARRALAAVHGVDVNPFAVAIARFRLLLAAMKATNQKELRNARAFPLPVACGDSLIHGDWHQLAIEGVDPEAHTYSIEDVQVLMGILIPGHYHAVVANPPYIVPRDSALNGEYRKRYRACHRQYSLAVPFMERIFQLAVPGGYTGQITANSFMKREFGKKLIEAFFPKVDLTHVIDTSGAYIPGHGTPTVILFGRNRPPIAKTIRTVMGIRGEPSTPEDPTQGLVWTAILEQIDVEGSESEFVSVANSQRDLFHQHPWSIGGGGATELKTLIENLSPKKLQDCIETICSLCLTRADDTYLMPPKVLPRHRVKPEHQLVMVQGEQVRDWGISEPEYVLFPYDEKLKPVSEKEGLEVHHFLWPHREILWRRRELGGDHRELNRTWWEWNRFLSHRFVVPNSISFAFVATHNHFVLDRGGKVFKQSAPVIKLPATATEADHLALLGLLNSSTACFWMKQVFYPKATSTGDISTEKGKPEANRYEFAGTGLENFPVPFSLDSPQAKRIGKIAKEMDALAHKLMSLRPASIIKNWDQDTSGNLEELLQTSGINHEIVQKRMICLQEELDWEVYQSFKLVKEGASQSILDDQLVGIGVTDRPFLWKKDTSPESLPEGIVDLYEKRHQIIQSDKQIRFIEDPVFKRPWWGRQGVYGRLAQDYKGWTDEALSTWLLNRLESYFDLDGRMNDPHPQPLSLGRGEPEAGLTPSPQGEGSRGGEGRCHIPEPKLISTAKLADIARQDPAFIQVGERYTHNPAFDVQTLINTLVEAESVPLLPVLRYKPSGLRKRQDWETTWALQRQEDAIDARTQHPKDHPDYLDATAANRLKAQQIGDIPVPPKYTSTDFLKPHHWKLRGKLDVPKERWVSFPHCAGPDGQPVIAWAGYDHLQLALALSAYFVYIKEDVGGHEDPRLVPLLGGLIELLPWLKQWHNHLDPAYGLKMGDYLQSFVDDEARMLGQTLDQIRAWEPPKTTTRRRK